MTDKEQYEVAFKEEWEKFWASSYAFINGEQVSIPKNLSTQAALSIGFQAGWNSALRRKTPC